MLPLVYTQHLVPHQGYLSHIERAWPQGRDMSTLELPLANQRLISSHESPPPPPGLPSEEDLGIRHLVMGGGGGGLPSHLALWGGWSERGGGLP